MARYVVKPGFTHGARNQFKAGDVVELTEQEAAGFLDKLQRVGDSTPTIVRPLNELQVTTDEFARAQAAAQTGNQTPPDPNGTQQPAPIDVATASADAVLAAVKDGKITANDALIAEQQGRKRVGLLTELAKLAEADDKAKEGEKPQG